MAAHALQERSHLARVQIAYSGAWKECNAGTDLHPDGRRERRSEVGDNGFVRQTGEAPSESRDRLIEKISGNIDEHVEARRAQCAHQDLGLDARARPILQESDVRSAKCGHLSAVLTQNYGLSSGGVVLVEFGYVFEELAAAVVASPKASATMKGPLFSRATQWIQAPLLLNQIRY
jgi:hypothetical protein